uniref:NALCN channel auxiliary factor 2 n=1 Tax=Latimeria chalumnae TaxID=7897 RepID=H3ANG2_LATCH
MIRGAWMSPREDSEAQLRICCCAPRQTDKPTTDSERAQRWRLSLASLLFFTVLLSDHLWLCAAAKDRGSPAGGEHHQRQPWQADKPYKNISSPSNFPTPASSSGMAAAAAGGGGDGGNQTKFAAPDLPCPDPHPTSFPDLESACTKLHSLPFRLAFRASPSKGDFLRAYFGNFSLSFCDSYSLLDLLLGMANPDSLDCSWDNLILDFGIGFGLGPGLAVGDHDQDGKACSSCIQAYQRLDQHAQEKYEELDSVFEKYFQSEDYSVRSCMGECKAIYKAWLCSEYFNVTQHQCHQRIPCKQYCVEVQTRCPFILPDNEDLVYGGLPSFICTGLLEKQLTNGEPECCDVRWSSCETPPSDSEQNTPTKSMESASPYHARTSPLLSSSSGPRLCNGRLRLCMLVLMLLHTVVSFSTAHSVGLETLSTIDESSTREE